MATYRQIKNVFIALAAFAGVEEQVHADAPSPGENDGYIERTLTLPARYAGNGGEGVVKFMLRMWDDHSLPAEFTVSFNKGSNAPDDVDVEHADLGLHCFFDGLTYEQHAVIRALLA